jgi:hypothetical protein
MRALLFGLALIGLSIGLAPAPVLACGSGSNIAAQIDVLLPKTQLAAADIEKVRAMRAEIAASVAAGNVALALKTEEQAMRMLGYRKALLRCGRGSFTWAKL